jgi:hypothetical protein
MKWLMRTCGLSIILMLSTNLYAVPLTLTIVNQRTSHSYTFTNNIRTTKMNSITWKNGRTVLPKQKNTYIYHIPNRNFCGNDTNPGYHVVAFNLTDSVKQKNNRKLLVGGAIWIKQHGSCEGSYIRQSYPRFDIVSINSDSLELIKGVLSCQKTKYDSNDNPQSIPCTVTIG